MKKPKHLKPWDKIFASTLSRGGPWAYPERYLYGKKQLEKKFWVKVIEWDYTMKDPEWIYNNPKLRAEDLLNAFLDSQINGIISTIWWEDSIRILPYIDFDIIKNNPKVFMWYSDTTISNFICYKAGLISFYWPAIMAWFAENGGMFDYTISSINKNIFDNKIIWEITENYSWWTNEDSFRNDATKWNTQRKLYKSTWWRWIQWNWVCNWKLLWWCIEVFPFMHGSNIRPDKEQRNNKVLFIETSEEKISNNYFERIVRNLGSQGILNKINWILVWRSQFDNNSNHQINYDESIIKIVSGEFGCNNIPIITNMDFGHTDPMMVLPIGVNVEIDSINKKVFITENACI